MATENVSLTAPAVREGENLFGVVHLFCSFNDSVRSCCPILTIYLHLGRWRGGPNESRALGRPGHWQRTVESASSIRRLQRPSNCSPPSSGAVYLAGTAWLHDALQAGPDALTTCVRVAVRSRHRPVRPRDACACHGRHEGQEGLRRVLPLRSHACSPGRRCQVQGTLSLHPRCVLAALRAVSSSLPVVAACQWHRPDSPSAGAGARHHCPPREDQGHRWQQDKDPRPWSPVSPACPCPLWPQDWPHR